MVDNPSNKKLLSDTDAVNDDVIQIEDSELSPSSLKIRNQEDSNFLKYNKTPWSEIEMRWRRTTQVRKQELIKNMEDNINSILVDWPLYQHSQGYNLVSSLFIF